MRILVLLAHLLNFLAYDRGASNVEPSAIHILSNFFSVNCILSGNGREFLLDHSELNIEEVASTESVNKLPSGIASPAAQRGVPEKNIAKLLERGGLAEAVMQGEEFHRKVENAGVKLMQEISVLKQQSL